MYDVHPHMLETTLQAYEKGTGKSADVLLQEVGGQRGEGLSWNAFVQMLDRCEQELGREAVIQSFSSETLTNPLLEASRSLLLLFGSPEAYFKLLNKVVGPRAFPGVRANWLHRSSGRLIFELEIIREELDSCELFFEVTQQAFKHSYRMLGVQDGEVLMFPVVPGRRVRYEMRSGRPRTLIGRARGRMVRYLLKDASALMEQQQQDLVDSYDALFEAHRQLESRVEDRTRELAELNRLYEAQSEAKTRYLAQMTHELRTPMHSIILGVGLLQDNVELQDFSSLPEDISLIENASHQLLQLIEDILDMSSIEAGRLTLSPERTSISLLLDSIQSAMRGLIDASGNGLALELDAPQEALFLDPKRLRQIVVNLLGNAAKFTSDGVITLRTLTTDEMWALEVEDTGVGMDDATLERLFEPFERHDRDRHVKGTGLGLPISRELARLMDGDLVARSVPGKGSVFRLELPLASVEP